MHEGRNCDKTPIEKNYGRHEEEKETRKHENQSKKHEKKKSNFKTT